MGNELTENELKEMKIEDLQMELEEYLDGLVICDDITRKERSEVLEDFCEWAKTAQYGDVYTYDDEMYELEKQEKQGYSR